MLIDEIERLHVDLWNAKAVSADGRPPHVESGVVEPSLELNDSAGLPETLRERLRWGRRTAG